MIVAQIVFTRPGQLDWRTHPLGNGRRLGNIVSAQAPPEPTAATGDVKDDLFLGNPQGCGHQILTCRRVLSWRPQLDDAIVKPGRGILRLDTGMRDERIPIGRLHRFRRTSQCRGNIAVLAQHRFTGLSGQLGCLGDEFGPVVVCCRPFVPTDLQLTPRGIGCPGRIRNNRHPRQQTPQIAPPVYHESIANPWQGLDCIQVGTDHLATENRTFLIHCVE
ncbi:hypothetical protein SDC9_169472 [bioreactor metagenome]|uniref:Uncharacterized protein n=1 Tax=bioreactor metagenome TaxID=1076179 RepID=A0A645G8H6_9ZZZZ